MSKRISSVRSSSSPPPKRNGFYIRELLDLPPSPPSGHKQRIPQIGSGSINKKNPEDYVEKLDNDTTYIREFKAFRNKSKFLITDVPDEPEGLLAGIFKHCIDGAIAESSEKGPAPDHLGCIIDSELLDPPVVIPIRLV